MDRKLDMNDVDPAQTKLASLTVLVPKYDGNHRFCVAYSKLSALTIRDMYPMLRTDEFIDSLDDA